MHALLWLGPAPTGTLLAGLRSLGAQLGAPPHALAVVSTRGKAVPAAPVGLPWVWLCEGAPSAAALREAAERGAYDAIPQGAPGATARLLARLAELLNAEAPPPPPPGFVAKSPAARALLARLHEASRTSQPVLLTGETGTGKEIAARLIHTWSRRAKSTFVPINCAAIPNELMEGELFGYVKGAFSGAVREYEGLVAAAEGGTVFLDEIDDTPHSLQVKLLRVLEDRVVSRLGESSWRRVDFRVLAATNRDLQRLIAEGTFGEDLFERLATVRIALPPLRERLEDLPLLVEQLVARYYQEETSPPRARVAQVLPEVLEVLRGWSWPGNIRELRNVIYGALVAKRAGDTLLVSDLPAHLLRGEPTARPGSGQLIDAGELDRRIAAGTMNLKAAREELERLALTSALRRANGNASAAARLLGAVGRGGARVPGDTVRVMARRLKVKVHRRGEG